MMRSMVLKTDENWVVIVKTDWFFEENKSSYYNKISFRSENQYYSSFSSPSRHPFVM
jgi:hypothetical protein